MKFGRTTKHNQTMTMNSICRRHPSSLRVEMELNFLVLTIR